MNEKPPDPQTEPPVGFSLRMPLALHRQLSDLSHRLKMQRGRKGHRTGDPLSVTGLILSAVQERLERDDTPKAA